MGVLVRKADVEAAKKARDEYFERLRQRVDSYEPGEWAAEELLCWLKLTGVALLGGLGVSAALGLVVWLLVRWLS